MKVLPVSAIRSLLIGLLIAYLLPASILVKFNSSAQWPVLMVISAVVIGWSIIRTWQGWRWHRTPFDWIILGWIAVVAFSMLLNLDRLTQMTMWVWYMAAAIGTWYVVYDMLANRAIEPRELLDAVLVAGVGLVIAAYVQVYALTFTQHNLPALIGGRLYGNLSEPNNLAGCLVIIMPVLVARLLMTRRGGLRIALVIYFVLAVIVVLWTDSRDAWISAAFVVGLLIVWFRFSVVRVGIAVVVLIGVALFSFVLRHDDLRIVLYDTAIQAFIRRPLSGYGPFSYESLLRQMYPNSMNNFGLFFYQAHDLPVQVAAELGLPGLIVLGALVWVAVREIRRQYLQNPAVSIVAVMALAASVPFLTFDNLLMNVPGVGVVMIFMLGVAIAPNKSNKPRRIGILLVTALWAGLLTIAFLNRGENTIFWATIHEPGRRLMVDFDAMSGNYARLPEWNQSEVSPVGETYQWSAAPDFGLNIATPRDIDLIVQFRVLQSTPADVLNSITLKANGDPIALDTRSDDHGGMLFVGVIPQATLAKSVGTMYLAFHTDHVVGPRTLDIRADRRTLGVAFDWLRLEPIPPILWSVATKFDGLESQVLLGSGWHNSEQQADHVSYRWTSATTFTMDAFMPADRDLLLEMRVIDSMAPDILDSLSLETNGESVDLFRQSDGPNGDLIRGVLPASLLAKSPQLTRLVFHTNRVVSPQSLGLSDDQRELGLAFANFQIVPVDAKNNIPGS